MPNTAAAIYLKHFDGATKAMPVARIKRLVKAVQKNEAGPILTQLAMEGYEGFLGQSGEVESIEPLPDAILAGTV